MKYLMIGGSGFLSGCLLLHLVRQNHTVICITRGKRPILKSANVINIVADRDTNDLTKIVSGMSYDIVLDIVCRNENHAQQSIDLTGPNRRLIMVSTDYVYDPEFRKLLQSEQNAIYSQMDDYAGNKYRAELMISSSMISSVVLRPPHIYGPGSKLGTIPNHGRSENLVEHIRSKKPLYLLQGGMGLIQPIYVHDLARIIIDLSINLKVTGVFNSGGTELITHADYYEKIASILGAEISIIPVYPNKKDVGNYVWGHRYYDMSLLNKALPNFDYTPFEDGMSDWIKNLEVL